MGLLDGILGNVMGSVLSGGQASQESNPLGKVLGSLAGGSRTQGGNLLGAAMAMIQQFGGLDRLLDAFRGKGMAEHADSWVSTGPNVGISAEQLQQVIGSSALGQIASQLGMSSGQAGSALAQVLPELVNQMTPRGSLPDNHGDLISQGLRLLRGGGA